jgi:tetratricopeptide (TPR) repeat protein
MARRGATPGRLSDKFWNFLMSWTGRFTAIVGLGATIAGGVTWIITHDREHRERTGQLALAQTQAAQGDYQASLETYAAILKSDPLDRAALEGQLNAAMLWAENFSVSVPEGESAAGPASRELDEMMPILESGLTRSKGTRAADVQAHLGWAHWLNEGIAERESGSAAEENLRAALATDPANVYANAMLGDWMLQNGGDFSVAVQHFEAAAATGKARPFVRQFQIASLAGSYDQKGARAELMKVANAMRRGGEPLNADDKRRVFNVCCDIYASHAELVESLSAVPPQDAWLTYLWLEDPASMDASEDWLRALTHQYIQANLLEISGQTGPALAQYRAIQQKLHARPGTVLENAVDGAVRRLSGS